MSAPARGTFRHRALRSDAAANRNRLLAAAAVAVKRDGEKVAMATVAGDAGVGVATLYRHYPTREALLSALAARSLEIVLAAARRAAASPGAAPASLLGFLDEAIERHGDLILPLHGGPVIQDPPVVALREAISQAIDRILDKGRADGSIRPDITSGDIIIMGALLSQPLPYAPNWARPRAGRPGSTSRAWPRAARRRSYREPG